MKTPTIDPFDSESPGFKTRCERHHHKDTGRDSTLPYRRIHYYSNITALCKDDCTYKGIYNSYIQCSCNNTNSEFFVQFISKQLDPIRTVNLDVVNCAYVAFTRVMIF
jgi:hypothetical protein